jgi:hypothetical protein
MAQENGVRETQLEQAKSSRMCPGDSRFFDNCILGNKEKDTGSISVPRDGLRHQHSWKKDTWENYGEH